MNVRIHFMVLFCLIENLEQAQRVSTTLFTQVDRTYYIGSALLLN